MAGVEGHLKQGSVEGELRSRDGRLARVEVEVEGHIRCQTGSEGGLLVKKKAEADEGLGE
jgi:hypothetical protein